MKESIVKVLLFLVAGFVFIVSAVFLITYNSNKAWEKNKKEYFDLEFKGIILKSQTVFGYGGSCLLKIKLVSSNRDHYDLRDSKRLSKAYLCVIDTGYAEVVSHCGSVKIYDTLKFENNILSIYNAEEVKELYTPKIQNFRRMYEIIDKLHDL